MTGYYILIIKKNLMNLPLRINISTDNNRNLDLNGIH